MSALPPDPAILEYIRANRALYSREAIARELAVSGHTAEDIAAAWAVIDAADVAETDPAPAAPATPPLVPLVEAEPFTPLDSAEPGRERDPAIDRYIRANRATYNRAAVTEALLASGHPPADIEAAWADVLAADAQPALAVPLPTQSTRREVLGSWRFWLTLCVAIVALIAVPPSLTAAFPDQPVGVGAGCVLVIGYLAAALILLGIGKARDVAYGLLWSIGAILSLTLAFALLAFILLVIVLGICLVALSQSNITP